MSESEDDERERDRERRLKSKQNSTRPEKLLLRVAEISVASK